MHSLQPSLPAPSAFGPARRTRVRWIILLLVFFAATINYLDRTVLAILGPGLQKEFGIDNAQYGYINAAFAYSYAAGQLACGGLLDAIGVRLGFIFAIAAWSTASMLHALAQGAWSFGFMRALLGAAESPTYPGAAKTLAEWFPRRERALAFGFVNAGTNMGAILAPAIVPWLASTYGWQWAFVGTGAVGFIWLAAWIPLYRKPSEHPGVSAAELAWINSDPPEPTAHIPWLRLIGYRQAWAFAAGKFLSDSMWWFFITWIPKFLFDHHGLDLKTLGAPLIVIYVMSDLGSVSGGWLSSAMIKSGASVNRARKTALLICAGGVLPVMFVQGIAGLWPAVLILGLATAAHQGFSANLYTLVSDMFPRRAIGSVAGFGGTWGFFGASLFQVFVGRMVNDQAKNYFIPFLCASLAYLVAVAAIQFFAPRLEPALLPDESLTGAL